MVSFMGRSVGGPREENVKLGGRAAAAERIIAAVRGLPDYHVHTYRCGHAGGQTRDFVLRGIERGLAEIGFTDHIPLYFLPESERDPKLAMSEGQFDGYLREIEELREEFAGRIAVRLGLEADYAEGREEELARLLSRADWDLVLGSVHWVAGGWIDDPATSPLRFASEGAEPLYDEYYRLLARASRTGLFDVLAHFDLPKKFGHRPATPRAGAEREAISAAKDAGCAVEISSAGLRKPVAEIYPEARLLREILAAGVPVTFSSDAHAPAEVGWGFERTLELARAAGAREYVTFAKRQQTRHPLP